MPGLDLIGLDILGWNYLRWICLGGYDWVDLLGVDLDEVVEQGVTVKIEWVVTKLYQLLSKLEYKLA